MAEVTVGGEPRQVGDFSAFKAATAMELIADAQEAWEKVLVVGAEFKRRYEDDHYVEVTRAEARRMFPPQVMVRDTPVKRGEPDPQTGDEFVRDDDGVVVFAREPILTDAGEPVLGPDPLGHLTEQDWAESDNKIRLREAPKEELELAAMVPQGYRIAKTEFLRLLALVLTPNGDLERWDEDESLDVIARLSEEGERLIHRAKLAELAAVALEAVRVLREELQDPFDQIRTEIKRAFPQSPDPDQPEPMRIEEPAEPEGEPSELESTTGSEPSSTPSPAATAGDGERSSTAAASSSSSSSDPE